MEDKNFETMIDNNNLNNGEIMENKETNFVEERDEVVTEPQSNKPQEEKPDLFRKISDAIPQKHVSKLIAFFIIIIIVGLGFNIYSAFWGTPKMRSQLKEKQEQVDALSEELKKQQVDVDEMFTSPIVGVDEGLGELGEEADNEDVFSAYSNSVEPEKVEDK